MKKRLKDLRYADHRIYWCANVLLLSGIFSFTVYDKVLKRLLLSLEDLGASIGYWFCLIFGRFFQNESPAVVPTVDQLPDFDLERYVGFDVPQLIESIKGFWSGFFDLYNFLSFNAQLLDKLYFVALAVLLLLPLVVLLLIVGKDSLYRDKEKPMGAQSRPYEVFLRVMGDYVLPFAKSLGDFFAFFWKKKRFVYVLVAVWLVNLNVVSIALQLLAFYFYFVSSFDVLAVGSLLVRLLIDVLIMLRGAPLFFWALVAGVIYIWWAVATAFDKLQHMESKNCGFIKSINLVSLVIGAPGLGKTQLITDMALSLVNIDKQKALDIMMNGEFLFPGFPFVKYRDEILKRVSKKIFYTTFAIDCYVKALKKEYEAGRFDLFGYDTKVYALKKNVGNRIVTLWDVLSEYGRAYMIYLQDNPSIANYPIRFDGGFDDSIYFPKWKGDFFKTSPWDMEKKSRFSHILDQDIMRMGKKVDPNNRLSGTFGYGIYSNTEWGKCRGNQLTNADMDKKDKLANAKNDLYSYSLKMCRHNGCTIAGEVFFHFLGDEQRPQSLAQDQRDLCSVISISEKSEMKLALPGASFIDGFYKKIYKPLCDFCHDYSVKRGDTVLSVQLVKNAVGWISWGYKYLYGLFGYRQLTLKLEDGTAYGEGGDQTAKATEHTYYLSNKKIFSDRYMTDCYSGFFEKEQLEAEIGLDDYPTFSGKQMTWEEMELQRDYFLMEMMQRMVGEVNPPPPEKLEKTKKQTKKSFDYSFVKMR